MKVRYKSFTTSFLLAIIFALLAGFRVFGLDNDYFNYLRYFNSLSEHNSEYVVRYEPGFDLLARFVSTISGSNFTIFLLISSSISLILKFQLLRLKPNFPLSVTIYFLILLPLHEMTQIRVGLACGFAYWAIHLSNKRYNLNKNTLNWKSASLLLLGAMFQASVLILLPFCLGMKKIFNFNKYITILIFGCFPALFIWLLIDTIGAVFPLIEFYTATIDETSANPFSSQNILFILFLIIGFIRFDFFDTSSRQWYLVSLMGMGLWYGMISFPVFAHRLLELTIFAYAMWIPALPKKERTICSILYLLLAVYLFLKAIHLEPLFIDKSTSNY